MRTKHSDKDNNSLLDKRRWNG